MPRAKQDLSTKEKQRRASKKVKEVQEDVALDFAEAVSQVHAAIDAEEAAVLAEEAAAALEQEDLGSDEEAMLIEHLEEAEAHEAAAAETVTVSPKPAKKKPGPKPGSKTKVKSAKSAAVKKPAARKSAASGGKAAAANSDKLMTVQMGSHILAPAVYTASDMAESVALPSVFHGVTQQVRTHRAAEVEAALSAATGNWARNMNWWQVLLFVWGEGMVKAAAQNQQQAIDSGKDVTGGDGRVSE